jgi:hypothetical protein
MTFPSAGEATSKVSPLVARRQLPAISTFSSGTSPEPVAASSKRSGKVIDARSPAFDM